MSSVLRITIIGVGLIGGSLGLALRRSAPGEFEITGVDSDPASLAAAIVGGVIDRSEDSLSAGVREADVVFLCTPVLQIPRLVLEILPFLKHGAILSDVGSTKGFLRQKITSLLPSDIHYVGGHPMAGREKSGVSAADENLFRGKMYILTAGTATCPAAVDTIAGIVRRTGANVTVMDVNRHDCSAAVISHVPHVAAAALVNLLNRYPGQEESLLQLAGGGFCDTTRIASSNADMWADICLTNAAAITDGLEQLQAIIDEVIDAIGRGDRAIVHDFFKEAKTRRDKLIASL
jgi:prephenate dehydrogenase